VRATKKAVKLGLFQALPRVPTSNGCTPFAGEAIFLARKKYLDIKKHDVMYLNAMNIV
jgi:hypothetical protein